MTTITGTLPTPPRYCTPGNFNPAMLTVVRQAAIENALSTALWHIRKEGTKSDLQAATGRAIRAATMLKQACTESRAAQ